jgi:hypothetical protein
MSKKLMGVYRRKEQGPDPLVRGTDPTIRIRTNYMSRIWNIGVMDPAPHSLGCRGSVSVLDWECGSGSRSMKIDQNLKLTPFSGISKRLLYLLRYVFWPITYFKYVFHEKIQLFVTLQIHNTVINYDELTEPRYAREISEISHFLCLFYLCISDQFSLKYEVLQSVKVRVAT